MWVANLSDIDFQSVGLERKKHVFNVTRLCLRAHSGLQGISVHRGSEDNRTSCEVTALAKHHNRKL